MDIASKFEKLGIDNAPGQQSSDNFEGILLRGEPLSGVPVDFSHGDVDAHPPIPGSIETFVRGFESGGKQAYTEYKGKKSIREYLAEKISAFAGVKIDAGENIILTSGTQGALFLAMGSNIMKGDKVAFVEPDYFANRKMVEFFDGEMVPVQMNWTKASGCAGLDLDALEKAFSSGVRLFLFSNPNNPAGVIYSRDEICAIARLARRYDVTVIADELYSRQIYDGGDFVHLCAQNEAPEKLITIIGPSKTESMSGYRLGVAFGNADIIRRMEKLQAIMALRCSGYNQAVFMNWFSEPEGWMKSRVAAHQAIRDDLMELFLASGMEARKPEGGSYLFVKLPPLDVSLHEFIKILSVQANVVITPGTEFGPQFLDWFRINFSQDHAKAVDAAKRLIEVMELYRR